MLSLLFPLNLPLYEAVFFLVLFGSLNQFLFKKDMFYILQKKLMLDPSKSPLN